MRDVGQAAACTPREEFNRCLKSLNQNNNHVCLDFKNLFICLYSAREGGGWGFGGGTNGLGLKKNLSRPEINSPKIPSK